jgi:hypothetical protein
MASGVVRAEGFSYAEMLSAIEQTGGAFVALIRSLDMSDGPKPVPGLDWTVAQTAAHLIGVVTRGNEDRRRVPTIEQLGALNMAQILELGEDDLSVIAGTLERLLHGELTGLATATGAEPIELYGGLVASLKTALSYELWDFLVHGHDISRATHRPWSIDLSVAALDVLAILPALEPWLHPDVRTGTVKQVAFTFPQIRHAILVRAGDDSYLVELEAKGTEREVDPVAMLLAISHREPSSDALISELASWFLPT